VRPEPQGRSKPTAPAIDYSASSVPIFLPSLRVSMDHHNDSSPSATVSPTSSISSGRSSYDGYVLPAASFVQGPAAAVPVFASNRSRRSLGRRGTDLIVPEDRETLVQRLLRSDPTSEDYEGINVVAEEMEIETVSELPTSPVTFPSSSPKPADNSRLPPLEHTGVRGARVNGVRSSRDMLYQEWTGYSGRSLDVYQTSTSFSSRVESPQFREPPSSMFVSRGRRNGRTESDPGTGTHSTLRDQIMARRSDKRLRVAQPMSDIMNDGNVSTAQQMMDRLHIR
jgi:hypothetical protein